MKSSTNNSGHPAKATTTNLLRPVLPSLNRCATEAAAALMASHAANENAAPHT